MARLRLWLACRAGGWKEPHPRELDGLTARGIERRARAACVVLRRIRCGLDPAVKDLAGAMAQFARVRYVSGGLGVGKPEAGELLEGNTGSLRRAAAVAAMDTVDGAAIEAGLKAVVSVRVAGVLERRRREVELLTVRPGMTFRELMAAVGLSSESKKLLKEDLEQLPGYTVRREVVDPRVSPRLFLVANSPTPHAAAKAVNA